MVVSSPFPLHPTGEQLACFGRGDLSEEDASWIEAHLWACSECTCRVAQDSRDDALVAFVRRVGRTVECRLTAGGGQAEVVPAGFPQGYELIEPIGRGGMGVVYKARQRALGRLVALKQVRAGLDADPRELARFQIEAEAASRLRHPNIVTVYDVGWRDGAPYIAMELVEGESLAERLARQPLHQRAAAALLQTIAGAIQHAHGAGVIHRDLKPANILITADGVPKVTDFGLAKRLDTLGPTQTDTGALLGTPSYMAPEQAGGKAIGPAADVFALGSLFYEMLTGRPPFRGATPLETLDQVRAVDPIPPGRFQPGVARDLDTICLRCLEKDPHLRYLTAGELADDLARYSRGEPIKARPISNIERLWKWSRRRPTAAALAALATVTILASAAGLIAHNKRLRVEIDRANRATEQAKLQRQVAIASYREARATIEKILSRLDEPSYLNLPRREELLRTEYEDAIAFFERVSAAADSADPVLQLDLARAARSAATMQLAFNRFEQAERNLGHALRLVEGLTSSQPDDVEVIREEAQVLGRLGILYNGLAQPDRAILPLLRARDKLVQMLDAGSAPSPVKAELAWCEHNLGMVFTGANRFQEAERHLGHAVTLNRSLLGENPADLRRGATLAENLINLGHVHLSTQQLAAAETELREAVALLEAAAGGLPAGRNYLGSLGGALLNWSNLAKAQGHPVLALERLGRGIELVDAGLRLEPELSSLRYVSLNLHGALAELFTGLGRWQDSISHWDRVIALNAQPSMSRTYRLLRISALVQTRDYARGIEDLNALLQAPPAGDRPEAPALDYELAGIYGLAATSVNRDQSLGAEERARRARKFADLAIARLRAARAGGLFRDPKKCDEARKNASLAPLHGRADFKDLTIPGPFEREPKK